MKKKVIKRILAFLLILLMVFPTRISSVKGADININGLPARGWGITRPADDSYQGAVEFVGRISDTKNNVSSYENDYVLQIYTYDEDNGKWVKKDGTKQVFKAKDVNWTGNNWASCIENGFEFSFTLEPGETCIVYPAQSGTGASSNPTVITNSRFDYRCIVGPKSTEQYYVTKVDDKEYTNSEWDFFPCIYLEYYGALYSKPSIKKVEIAPQQQIEWGQQTNGLPNAGLQIQYEIGEDVDFSDFANIQLDTLVWEKKKNYSQDGTYYNGESTLGSLAENGYKANTASIIYRVDLYEKNSDDSYSYNRTLTDHIYILQTDDASKLFDSIEEQLRDAEVKEILNNGGVISIIPLSKSGYTYAELTGTDNLSLAEEAPVFGFDYYVDYMGKSNDYTVQVDNQHGSVGSQTNLDGQGEPLQMVKIKVDKTEGEAVEQGLVIDGSSLEEGTTQHLYVHLIPESGHVYDGKQTLRFLARVYKKNSDGTYTAKVINADSHYKNWDYVQVNPESTGQKGSSTNFNWQDNRYIECELSSDEVVIIYPIAWDDTKSNWQWYPYSVYDYDDSYRYAKAFNEIDIQDTSEWSFGYKIGVDDTYNNLLIGATCENGNVQVENGILSSTENVETNEQQIVKLQMDDTEPIKVQNSEPDGGLDISFEGLENIADLSYDEFYRTMCIYIKAVADGRNGAGLGSGTDLIYMRETYYDKDGNALSVKISSSYDFTKLQEFNIADMTETEFNVLKDGGKLVILPVTTDGSNAKFYSFYYGFSIKSDTDPFKIESIIDNGSQLTSLNGIYNGGQMLSHDGIRKADVIIKLAANENAEDKIPLNIRTEGDSKGLPDYGMIFTIDKAANSTVYDGALWFDFEISAPREKSNGENPLENSNVKLQLLRYEWDSDEGEYKMKEICGGRNSNGVTMRTFTAEYPESQTYTFQVNFFNFDKSVFVLLPVNESVSQYEINDINMVDEFEFKCRLTGVRVGNYDITGIQENEEKIDPLSDTVQWSEVITGIGPYQDRFSEYTFSSDSEDSKLLNLKINITGKSVKANQKVPTLISDKEDLTVDNMDNIVVIRNNAKNYTADVNNADSMPDIKVTISVSQKGCNASPNWLNVEQQLPFKAFLYNYDDGTYVRVNEYYSFDNTENPISGPTGSIWGVKYGQSNYFHTHLADNQAIVIVPCSNYYSFEYEVSIKNSDKFTIESYTFEGGQFSRKAENRYKSGTIANYGTSFQEVVLTTAVVDSSSDEEKVFAPLKDYLSEGQKMQQLAVTLFDYDFEGLTATDYSGQTSQYKFLYDPLNFYDYNWNHIGDNKTLVYSEIVQEQLGEDNTPVFNYTVPFNLFNEEEVTDVTNGGTKNVSSSMFEFVYEEATGTYSYNSHLNHAQLEEDGVIHQYNRGLGLKGWGSQAAGFFPYNRWEDEGGNWGSAKDGNANTYLLSEEQLEYHFGMTMDEEFMVPIGGQYKGNDMVFTISGDDDIWVFIDGTLVLDIGGIHEAVEGEINFTNGTYTVNGKTSQLSDLIENYDSFGGLTGEWATGTKHSFKFVYLERGGTLSNLDISFNIPLVLGVDVTKVVESNKQEDYDKSYSFNVELFADEDGAESYTGQVLILDEDTNTFQDVQATDGVFNIELKDKETQKFYVQPEAVCYRVTEYAYDGFNTSWTVDDNKIAKGITSGLCSTADSLVCINEREEEEEEMEDPQNPQNPQNPEETPDTGDNAPIVPLMFMAMISAFVICVTLKKNCKSNYQHR